MKKKQKSGRGTRPACPPKNAKSEAVVPEVVQPSALTVRMNEITFPSGVETLAEKANCPVVPIVVDTRCQPTREKGMLRKIFKDFGTVDPSYDIRICAGPVIPSGKAKAMHVAAFDWMAGKLEEWGLPTER